MYKYQPKKPVKSFQDLAVYQITYNLAVTISSLSRLKAEDPRLKESGKIKSVSLSIPRLIVVAHSIRFADPQKAIDKLEQAMLNCNLAVHYLSLARDQNVKGPTLDIDQLQKDYLQVRRKILNLQRSWLRFMQIKNQNA